VTRALLGLVAAVLLGHATAHATLVFGELTFDPDPITPDSPTRVTVTLEDPTLTPIEDAIVALEFRSIEPGAAPPSADAELPPPLREIRLVETTPAVYTADVDLPDLGTYSVRVRDRTFEWEEATASVVLVVDARPLGVLPFILPPTQVSPAGLTTWLLWLVGIPLIAGAVVTTLVLTSNRSDDRGTANGSARG
jgi:hypothetical protein